MKREFNHWRMEKERVEGNPAADSYVSSTVNPNYDRLIKEMLDGGCTMNDDQYCTGEEPAGFLWCSVCCLCGVDRDSLDKAIRLGRTIGTTANVAVSGKCVGFKVPIDAVQKASAAITQQIGKAAAKKLAASLTGVGAAIWIYDIGMCAYTCSP